ncbi:MAG: restriction endonuclease subunit S [Roseovarius sp.]|nr:restriction endonuclease subunit S [Roseovarius sp.]
MGEWLQFPLGALVENLDARRVPLSSREREKRPGPFPYYGATGVMDYIDDFLFEGLHLLVAEDGSVERPDGKPFVQLVTGQFWVNNHAHVLRGENDQETKFLYYVLSTIPIRPYVSGSVQAKLSQANLNRIPIPYPKDKRERAAIVDTFSALDDKIELNRRMNATLEAMARAIFRDWFVDFGPTRAKIEGREPYLAPDLWPLFPARLTDQGIPEGWEMGTLGDVAESPRRGVKPSEIPEHTPYIGLEHMPRRSIALSEWEGAGKVTSNKSAFRKGEFLFGKLRPYFHKVGVAPVDGICSTDIVVVRPKRKEWSAYTLACISSDDFVEFTNAASTGTKMPRTSWKVMSAYETCLGTNEVVAAYQRIVAPMIERIIANIHESRTLAQTRDLLLPRLMSGELRVAEAEAEKIVEGGV